MDKDALNFLRELVGTASPSGFEAGIQALIRRRMARCCDEVRTDVHGNVAGILNPGAPLRVMLAGHCDEVGFMVIHIDEKGYLYIGSVGGVDPAVAAGQRVILHGSRGPVAGVIGRKPIHLLESEERGKPAKVHDLWIDIGARSRKEAEKVVAVGDYATIDAGYVELQNHLVAARGFDDRAGAFVIVEALRRLKGRALKVAVFGVTTVQEEVGLRGARTSAYDIDPHVGITVEVGFATDHPGADPKRTGECRLGRGPMLNRGPNINPVLGRLLEDTARRKKIPYQISAEPRATGTDANAIQVSRRGVATALIRIPNRYMHTPVEVVSLEDLEHAIRLLVEVLVTLDPKTSFIP